MTRSKVMLVLGAAVATLLACNSGSSDTPPGESSSSGGSSSGGSSSGGSSSGGSSSGGSSSGGSSSSSGGSDAGADGDGGPQWVGDGGVSSAMSFFVTSRGPGNGGDLRAAGGADGLAGADAFCKQLATAVSPVLGAKTWRAYLSTGTVAARSRIGTGPWYNAKGVVIAADLAQLHDEGGKTNALSLANTLDELGNPVPIAAPNLHDILTGSNAAGGTTATHCNNWTSNATNQTASVGHSNRMGGGAAPTSWNAAHATGGCAENGGQSVKSGGGRGSFYCFAL